jgi:hypothetical protein
MEWAIEATKLRNDGKVEITLAFAPSEITSGYGYDAFQLRFRVTVGSDLELELETRTSPSPMFIKPRFPGSKALPTSTRPTDSNAKL